MLLIAVNKRKTREVKRMRKFQVIFNGCLIAAVLMLGVHTAKAWVDDIAIGDLPKAVVESIQKRFPSAKMISAEKEEDDGKLHYEVKIQDGTVRREVDVRADGTIIKVEVDN